ncbi:MAG: hypothetical protein IKU15_02855 [Clostridia bacterium]|nr:hypothetical protein [Clostridia bacterium]
MVSDAGLGTPDFQKNPNQVEFITAAGDEVLELVLGNKAHYVIQIDVVSASGPVIKHVFYNIETGSGLNATTVMMDVTNGPEGAPTITNYYDDNSHHGTYHRVVKITEANGRDIIAYAIGY